MWRVAWAFALMGTFAGSISSLMFVYRALPLVGTSLVLMGVSAVGGAFLALKRKPKSEIVADLVFLAIIVTALATIWLNHEYYVQADVIFTLFAGYKLVALLIALFAPPRPLLGWTCLVVVAFTCLAQYYSWPEEVRQGLSIQEPWFSIIVFSAACVIYVNHLRSRELARRIAELRARSVMLQRFANLLINAQHLVNTPLQTIANTTKLLKHNYPETTTTLAPVDRALCRIGNIVALFSKYDSYVSWYDIELPDTLEGFQNQARDLFEDEMTSARPS